MQRAPGALSQAVTTGVIMVLTATIASLTMGYALHRAFAGDTFALPVAIGGGILWGSFVLALDRLLLLGIDKTDSKLKLIGQVLVRLPIAVVIGVAISKPVILRISQSILDLNLRKIRMSSLDSETAKFALEAGLEAKGERVDSLRKEIRNQEARVQGVPNSFECNTARQELRAAEQRLQTIRDANQGRIAAARQTLARIVDFENPLEVRRAATLRANIDRWRSEVTRAAEDSAAADHHLKDVEQEWLKTEQEKLDRMRKELGRAAEEHTTAVHDVEKQREHSNDDLSKLMRPNLVNEYTTLKRIEADTKHPDAKSLARFELSLDLLFILFEMTPLLAKLLSKVNALDHAAKAVDMEDEERINLRALANLAGMQKAADVSRSVHDTALDQWESSQMAAIENHPNLSTQILRDLRREISNLPIMTGE
jgi:hypothetical protein